MDTTFNEEVFTEDPAVSELINKIKQMSGDELIADILRHEKEVRGIDWAQLLVDDSRSKQEIKAEVYQKHCTYLRKLQAELEVSDDDLPEITQQFFAAANSNGDVQVMPAWAIDDDEAEEWKAASGDALEDMISFRLKIMQALELTSAPGGYAELMLSIGILAWMKRAYDLYKAARVLNIARLAAMVKAIKGVTLQATKLFVATVVVAVVAEILLFLMQKDAVVYMVLINMTDDDLKKDDQYLTHGKQIVQFVNPLHETREDQTLVKRSIIDLGGGEIERNYWIGLYSAQKKDMALYGSQGAFRFAKCPTFPEGAYVGWEIPLTDTFFSGGPNRCLVAASGRGSTEGFSNETDKYGSLFSEARSAKAKVTGRMHKGNGSKGYMSAIFEAI